MEAQTTYARGNASSVNAVRNLMQDFKLNEANEAAEFEAEIDFLVRGVRKISFSRVKITRLRDNYIVTLLNKAFNPTALPLEFTTGLQTFIYFVKDYLFIAGFNPNATIGSYTVSISPK
jgi:hypothetical protein